MLNKKDYMKPLIRTSALWALVAALSSLPGALKQKLQVDLRGLRPASAVESI